jgi:hypothetical protein
MTDIRDIVRLSRTMTGDDRQWAAWQARIDAARSTAIGPPHAADVALARRLGDQERILFGQLCTPGLL